MKKMLGGRDDRSTGCSEEVAAAARCFDPTRRRLIAAAVLVLAAGPLVAAEARPAVDVWKDPQCGCCKGWVEHLEANGFRVQTHDVGNSEARHRLGMPEKYGACHTARVGNYVIEGHVPARDIVRLLKDKPDAVGLAVLGMPRGSPGMDGPEVGGARDPYDVLLVRRDGSVSVYRSHQ